MKDEIRILEEKLEAIKSDPQGNPGEKISVLNDLARLLCYSDLNRSHAVCLEIRELLEIHPDPVAQARCQSIFAETLLRQGDYRKALIWGHSTMKLVDQIPEIETLKPQLWSTLGVAYWQLGNLAQALSDFRQQYQSAQKFNNKRAEINALNNIGLIENASGDLESANRTYQQAIQLNESFMNINEQAILLNNLAMNQYDQNECVSSLENGLKALELARSINNRSLEIAVLDTLGLVYIKQCNYDKAKKCFLKTIALANKVGAEADRAKSWFKIGEIYRLQGDYSQALSQLHEAIKHLELIEQKKELFECHHLLSEIYEQQGILDKALYHHREYHFIKEQIFNEQADQRLKHLQIGHEVNTLKKEAEIHRLKNIELRAALEHVKKLSGLLPICANCKNIRDDSGYWQDVAVYIRDHSEAEFSHGICPDCMEKLYPDFSDESLE